jgi:RHS repeat-associated protein
MALVAECTEGEEPGPIEEPRSAPATTDGSSTTPASGTAATALTQAQKLGLTLPSWYASKAASLTTKVRTTPTGRMSTMTTLNGARDPGNRTECVKPLEYYRYQAYGTPDVYPIVDTDGNGWEDTPWTLADNNTLMVTNRAARPDYGRWSLHCGNEWLFQARRWIAAAGYGNFRHRAASPLLARWFSRDPAGRERLPNAYRFLDHSPTKWRDPHGLAVVAGCPQRFRACLEGVIANALRLLNAAIQAVQGLIAASNPAAHHAARPLEWVLPGFTTGFTSSGNTPDVLRWAAEDVLDVLVPMQRAFGSADFAVRCHCCKEGIRNGANAWAFAGSGTFNICPQFYRNNCSQMTAIMLHELVHASGGGVVDWGRNRAGGGEEHLHPTTRAGRRTSATTHPLQGYGPGGRATEAWNNADSWEGFLHEFWDASWTCPSECNRIMAATHNAWNHRGCTDNTSLCNDGVFEGYSSCAIRPDGAGASPGAWCFALLAFLAFALSLRRKQSINR